MFQLTSAHKTFLICVLCTSDFVKQDNHLQLWPISSLWYKQFSFLNLKKTDLACDFRIHLENYSIVKKPFYNLSKVVPKIKHTHTQT